MDILSGGKFLLDGGTMFGVIPKSLWARKMEADAENRILMETNCLLARDGSKTALIEAGIGYDFSEKERGIYGIQEGDNILRSLEEAGVSPEEVDFVFLSHLHFDHAGGAIKEGKDKKFVPVFPNARHIVQNRDWDDAMENYGVMKSSYQPERLKTLQDHGILDLIEGDREPVPGIKCVVSPGHCRGHQIIFLQSKGQTLLFCGDLFPTSFHVKPSWIMAYDLFPCDILREKRKVLESAAEEEWILSFYHDPAARAAMIEKTAKGDYMAHIKLLQK